jgi:hypothetical protein
MSEKPTIFISSTIFDFADMRSALKYWLEEVGYSVSLSESTDFSKPLDKNSYEACLEAISQAQYFILLIGGRVGGLYDAAQRVSITRMEYRTAYELVKQGRMKMLIFIRQSIWTIKEDRKLLTKLLRDEYKQHYELPDEAISALANHQSTFVNDADAIFSFIDEVARKDEMKAAMSGRGDLPVANWIHPFSTFRDIVDALRVGFRIAQPLEVKVAKENLRQEAMLNFAGMLSVTNGRIRRATAWAAPARSQYVGSPSDTSEYSAEQIKLLFMYAFLRSHAGRDLATHALNRAIDTGVFLEFNSETGEFAPTKFHTALVTLRENIARLTFLIREFRKDSATLLSTLDPLFRGKKRDALVRVNNFQLINVFGLHDAQENVMQILEAMLAALAGDETRLDALRLNPTSPIAEEAEKLAKERVSVDQVKAWLAGEISIE